MAYIESLSINILMSFLVGIILGIIIAILLLVFILCMVVLSTLEYADTHIDNLAKSIQDAIQKGKEIAKTKTDEYKGKGMEEGAENDNKINQLNFVNSNLLYSEDMGRYILK